MRPPVILLSFANNKDEHLDELTAEKDAIADLLVDKQSEGYFLFDNNSITVEKLRHQLFKYKPQVNILHYSGHANGSQLLFEDQVAYSAGLLESIKSQTNLQLVFLNGCSTKGQVRDLLAIGVPAVIATSVKVKDKTARVFATDFYKNLVDGETIYESFMVASEVKTKNDRTKVKDSVRQLGYVIGEEEDENSDKIAWGLYINPNKRDVIDWKLPDKSYYELIIKQSIDDLASNDEDIKNLLLQTFYNVLMTYSDELEKFKDLEKKFAENNYDFAKFDKRLIKEAIINSLPSPIGLQVRRLFSPDDPKDDFPENTRLKYLICTYTVIIDMLVYIMFTQLWEELEKSKNGKSKNNNPLIIDKNLSKIILGFFYLTNDERQGFDAVPLIQSLRELFVENKIDFFVDEIKELKELLEDKDGEFYQAYNYLKDAKKKYWDINSTRKNFTEREIKNACREVEIQLCNIFKELGFCSKYKFATIKKINIEKKKYKDAIFIHNMFELNYADQYQKNGDEKEKDFENFTDTNAVIIYKTENKKIEAYNLFPFIIDSNTILKEDYSQIYFFSNYKDGEIINTNCTYSKVEHLYNELDIIKIPLDENFFNDKQKYKLNKKEIRIVFNETLVAIEEFISNFK